MENQNKEQIVSVEDLKLDSKDPTASTTYHIYHTGKGKRPPHYSIHSLRDSETTILEPVKIKKSKEDKKKEKALKKSNATTPALPPTDPLLQATASDNTTQLETTESKAVLTKVDTVPVKGLKKLALYDHPLRDPRVPTAPYFIHLPKLFGHEPPYTLRYGGHKLAPVAALLHPSSLWMSWKLEFGDVLKQEGVIDGRGVVNGRFGTKNGKGGFLKGYKVGKRRWWGENGKSYWLKQKEEGFPDNVDRGDGEKVKAEETVELKWAKLWARDYGFTWREFKFLWKGTRKVDNPRKAAKAFVWCNHLKLVVCLEGKGQMALARYVCVMGNRKAGRLEIDEDAFDGFLREFVFKKEGEASPVVDDEAVLEETSIGNQSSVTAAAEISVSEGNAKTQQRLRDVIMGTMICMLITERDKRRFLLEILQEIGENAGG